VGRSRSSKGVVDRSIESSSIIFSRSPPKKFCAKSRRTLGPPSSWAIEPSSQSSGRLRQDQPVEASYCLLIDLIDHQSVDQIVHNLCQIDPYKAGIGMLKVDFNSSSSFTLLGQAEGIPRIIKEPRKKSKVKQSLPLPRNGIGQNRTRFSLGYHSVEEAALNFTATSLF
jgi:hypothetical protein